MFLPHLVRNAIYQQPVVAAATAAEAAAAPAAASVGGGLLRQLLKGLVVAEFHCSVALRRRLDWTTVNLWPSELPANSTIVLSGRDNLVPVAEVRQILVSHNSTKSCGMESWHVTPRPDAPAERPCAEGNWLHKS